MPLSLGELIDALTRLRGGWNPDVPYGVRPGFGLQGASIQPQGKSPYETTLAPGEQRTPEELRSMLGEVVLAAGAGAVPGGIEPMRAGRGLRPPGALGRESLEAVKAQINPDVWRFNQWRLENVKPEDPYFMAAHRLETAMNTLHEVKAGRWDQITLGEAKSEARKAFNNFKTKLPKEQRGILWPFAVTLKEKD